MKKVTLALLLALALCMPCAVAEEVVPVNPEDCLGVWYATQMGSDGVMYPYALMGAEMSIEFFADGTVAVRAGEEERSGTWEIDDQGAMTLHDAEMAYGVTLNDGTLVMNSRYMLIYLEREPAAAEPLPDPDTDVTEASFVGIWNAMEMESGGVRFSVDGIEMRLTINADHTAQMASPDEAPTDLTWSLDGYTISITDGASPVACSLRGGRLVLEAEGTLMIFDLIVE